ncbi:hypothetical protein BDW42DRAFT_158252 [Aspergillus taichungensis]|uniref:PHD-type domain-containing protein n=1 Tax=Aspergillus taichungensis TaxID=482145 RepID=A0A2J5I9Q8_9EURO|nr:hypothetical protein BDW42DRAFT_158252 [Aspergillus taichungensis]
MSWDQPVHSFSYPNGEPQTPTRTPPVFGDTAFQTPKLESSFFDPRVTWDTSDPYASSPEFLRTPHKFALSTPSLNHQRLPETGADQSGGQSAKALEHQTDTARRVRPANPRGPSEEDAPQTVASAKSAASMQTPPPSSASKRKVTGLGNVQNTNRRPSASSVVDGSHLETPSRLMGASPRLFGDLQASSDPFHLGTVDPSVSPFYPQQRLFWDHDFEQPESHFGLPDHHSSVFDAHPTGTLSANTHAVHDSQIPQLPDIGTTMELPDFQSGLYGISSAPTTDAALFPAPFSTSPRIPVTKAEDPAMFLSSPARRFGGPQPTPEKRLFSRPPIRQPYHHQTEESKREELRRVQYAHHSLLGFDEEDEEDYTPRQPQPIRPGLTRSLTHTAATSRRPLSSGMMASTNGIHKSPSKRGRSSPIKPTGQPLSRASSTASVPTRSQSVVLRIGRDGRAKTEMQTVPESSTGLTDPVTGMDLDGSTTESEYDSAEYLDHSLFPSRNTSFAFSDAGRSMLAHSDCGSRPHSKGSYTSAASSQSGRVSPWSNSRGLARRPTYHSTIEDWKRTTPKRQVVNPDLSYRSASSAVMPLPESEEDDGDAQHALRKVLRQRQVSRPHTVGYGSRMTRAPPSLAHLRSSPPRFGAELDLNACPPNPSSPTTMTDPDLATPTTDRFSNPSSGTRCICNSMDNGGHLMIQCESCSHWLHTKCVGLERSNLPSSYVCVFCAQTPTRRNRIRVPVGPVGHAPASPLAHKSFRFR